MVAVKFDEVENKVIIIRNTPVILDSEVASLYGVQVKRINEAVKNNIAKFPRGYVLAISKEEWPLLKSKISSSIKGGKVKLPKAFTEKGLYMLATILKSPQATQTTIAIIEAFSKLKTLSRNIKSLSVLEDDKQKHSLHQKNAEIITEIFCDDLVSNETETTIEFNFAVVKFKHVLKRKI